MTPAVDIRSLRINRGLSIAEAAKQMDVAAPTLDRAERGGKFRPRPRNAKKIADFYGYQVTDIWPVAPVATKAAA